MWDQEWGDVRHSSSRPRDRSDFLSSASAMQPYRISSPQGTRRKKRALRRSLGTRLAAGTAYHNQSDESRSRRIVRSIPACSSRWQAVVLRAWSVSFQVYTTFGSGVVHFGMRLGTTFYALLVGSLSHCRTPAKQSLLPAGLELCRSRQVV